MSTTTTLSLRVVGYLDGGYTVADLEQHAGYTASFLLPGCEASEVAVADQGDGTVALSATLAAQTTPLPESAGYGTQVPDAPFLAAYIRGAGGQWITSERGVVFVPWDVTVSAK